MKKLLLILLCVPLIGFGQSDFEKTITLKMLEDGYTGEGTYKWVSGASYVGEWKNGKKHGKGTYKWVSGSEYVGEWKDDITHGEGTHTYANGDKYVGEYKYGKKNGLGIITFRDGNQYIGEFKDGQMNGQGALTFVNGIIEEGIWENNIYLGKNKDCKTPRIFGNLTICLPDVKGMIECYSDPIFKNSIDKIAAANPGQIPIASYIEGNSYDNIYTSLILNKGLGEYPWISVFSIEQLKNKAVIQDDIRKMANSLSETFDDYDFRKINEKLSKSIPYYNFKIDQPVLLERYITNSKIESLMSIIKYYNDGVEIYELSIMNFLIIDNRCILYTYYDRYKGQKTIDNLKAKNDYFGLYLIQENK